MSKSNKTDATQSRLGDDYHLLIALEYCMAGKDGDIVHIEKYGDIAWNNSISVESKHHVKADHTTGTYHKDIWKTIYNWINDYSEFKKFKNLKLVSTSKLSDKNLLKDWNDISSLQRFKLISQLSGSPDVPDTTEKYAKKVKSFVENTPTKEARDFFSKVILSFDNHSIDDKIKSLTKSMFLKGLPSLNRLPYLHQLYGYIVGKRIENPHHWKIEIDSFNNYHILNGRNYVRDIIPIPDTFKNASIDSALYQNYNFVKQLEEIDLRDRIPMAANDYFRAQQTTLMLVNDNPLCVKDIEQYQEVDVYERLDLLKSEVGLDIDVTGHGKCSKKCYLRAMQMELLDIGGYNPNRPFFQRGTIHSVVDSDDNDFSWKYNKS